MKAIKFRFRLISYFLILLMVFQSCTIYRSSGVTLDQAVFSGDKVEVVTQYDKTIKYKYITQEEGTYYGVKKVKGEFVKSPFQPEQVKTVRLKNKPLSTVVSVFGPIIIIGGLIAFALSADSGSQDVYLPPFPDLW